MDNQRKLRRTHRMKTSLLLRTLLLASALAGTAAHAADPQPAPAAPDIQTLMAMLNRLVAEAGVELAPEAEEAPAPAPAAKAAADSAPAAGQPPATSLKMSSLAPSAALGGRGANPNARTAGTDWRALFPLKQPRN